MIGVGRRSTVGRCRVRSRHGVRSMGVHLRLRSVTRVNSGGSVAHRVRTLRASILALTIRAGFRSMYFPCAVSSLRIILSVLCGM